MISSDQELDKILQQALELVYLDYSNHLFHQTNYHIHYLKCGRPKTASCKTWLAISTAI